MRNTISFSDEDQLELPRSAAWWWRTPQDYDEEGHLKMDYSDMSSFTPRIKLLREMDRLAFVASEGIDDLRHKLISYRSGDFWLPVGGIKKEDMEIPPVITILLVGLSASGKSSLVNLMYSVLGRSGLIPFAQTSSGSSYYTTMILEEHNVLRSVRSGFCVFDTRGTDHRQMNESLEEVSSWMTDGVRHNQPCLRPGDGKLIDEAASEGLRSGGSSLMNARFVKRQVNCVMVVADLSEIHKAFKSADMKSVEALRDLFHSPSIRKSNENPILILTHGDLLKSQERIDSRLKICDYLGIHESTGAYDIACINEQGILPEESDPVTGFALAEAVYRALMLSDRTHLPKSKIKDWVVRFLLWLISCIACFFAMLARFFSKFGHEKNHKLKL